MKIEIITIGDEILIGQIIDTNSAWIAQELTRRGFEITAISSVGDEADAIITAMNIAFGRADVLLLTGGVGPTNDDITKLTLCRYFNTSLVFSDQVLENIQRIFSQRSILLNELTRNQAYVPENSTVIQNEAGTAPILWFEKNEKILVSMPGVPYEMKTVMKNEIIPRLQQIFQAHDYLRHSFLVSGITESSLAILLSDFEKNLPAGFSLAYLPSFGFIRLRLSAWGHEHEHTIRLLAEKLTQILGNLLIAESENLPEGLLGEALRKKHRTLSTAESCTGGYIAHRITVVPGASEYYKGSIVSYDNNVKEEMLEVDRQTLETHGAVSREVVEQMAQHVACKFKTDCSIAVSGIMGPDGGSTEKPVGTVWIATYFGHKTTAEKYQMGKSREENIYRTANTAILQLLKMMGLD